MLQTILKPESVRQLSLIMLVASSLPLILALISQYGFDMHPCELCIYQRIPYIVEIILAILLLFLNNYKSFIIIALFSIFAYMTNVGLSFYHIGVEYGWWSFGECSSTLDTSSFDALKNSLLNAAIVRCDEVQFSFLGLSMAGWNLVYSIALSFYLSYLIYIVAKDKKAEQLL
jgi:disulfide bond formation protein DsbB